ncbi:WXG100 family type VII secretion target [Nocardia sp. GAS34]|uniref:WXG100 family type VII secretion target n=1 Tax=unclassified Nocardia TaxID=2637762 RepID=UPI003D1EC135
MATNNIREIDAEAHARATQKLSDHVDHMRQVVQRIAGTVQDSRSYWSGTAQNANQDHHENWHSHMHSKILPALDAVSRALSTGNRDYSETEAGSAQAIKHTNLV